MAKKAKATKKNPVGRPVTTKWPTDARRWNARSNAELATALGVTPAAVCTKRKHLNIQDQLNGGDGTKFNPKDGVRYRRATKASKGKGSPAKAKG